MKLLVSRNYSHGDMPRGCPYRAQKRAIPISTGTSPVAIPVALKSARYCSGAQGPLRYDTTSPSVWPLDGCALWRRTKIAKLSAVDATSQLLNMLKMEFSDMRKMYGQTLWTALFATFLVCALPACSEDMDEINQDDSMNEVNSAPGNNDNSAPGNNDDNAEPNNDDNAGTNNDDNAGTNNDTNSEPSGEAPVPGVDPSWAGGHSVEQRPIIVEHYGESGPVLLFVSAIHGQERLAVTYGERFRTTLNAGFAREQGIQVVFMQVVNPDGTAIYDRFNTNGIDLNRNFDTFNFNPGSGGGDTPLSEPETVAITDAVDASNLTAALTMHCCVPTFDPDGPAEELAEAMSMAMDSQYRFGSTPLGAASGSMGSYVGVDMNRPIVTVEFAGSTDMDPFVQLEQMDLAVDAAGQWTSDNPGSETIQFDQMTTEDHWDFRSRFAGESADGLPLRVESVGEPDGQPFVLLSGFDGSSHLGPWIAEHIRRELLAVPHLDLPLWHIMTGINPDGLANNSADNGDGIHIASAVADGDDSSDEAAAVLEILDEAPSTVFLVMSSDDATDRVEVTGPNSASLSDHISSRFESNSGLDDSGLADVLAENGHTVVQIMVGTENAEAQIEAGNWQDFDTSLNSPFDFSEMVFDMMYGVWSD